MTANGEPRAWSPAAGNLLTVLARPCPVELDYLSPVPLEAQVGVSRHGRAEFGRHFLSLLALSASRSITTIAMILAGFTTACS